MNQNKNNTPWGKLLVGGILLSAAIGTVIFKLILPGMPDIFLFLGIIFLVLGLNYLYKAYTEMQSDETELMKSKSVSSGISQTGAQATSSGIEEYISDKELVDNYKKALKYAVGCCLLALFTAPLMFENVFSGNPPGPQSLFFAVGFGLALPFTFFVFKYRTDPEWYREFLYKRKYKKSPPSTFQPPTQHTQKQTTSKNFCPHCASRVKEGHKFCSNCSSEL